MQAYYRFIILMILFSCYINTNAQDITISSTDLVNLKNEVQQLKDTIVVFKDSLASMAQKVESKDRTIAELAFQNEELQSTIATNKIEDERNGSLLHEYENKNRELLNQIQTIQEVSDRNTAKFANGRLYFKYDEKLVQSSIGSLSELKTERVKKDFDQALRLLQNYKLYSEDVKGTFVALQSIDRNEWKSKYQVQEYKNNCHSILQKSEYYQNVYKRKGPSVWTIPYLDNLIDAAKSIISKHNPVEFEFANFTPLIEMLP